MKVAFDVVNGKKEVHSMVFGKKVVNGGVGVKKVVHNVGAGKLECPM